MPPKKKKFELSEESKRIIKGIAQRHHEESKKPKPFPVDNEIPFPKAEESMYILKMTHAEVMNFYGACKKELKGLEKAIPNPETTTRILRLWDVMESIESVAGTVVKSK
ncbi:MAG: hypothetical protein FWC83_01735 [Alphaproteobacteria bacterium]|nr:hypothetical protein [Alphaproteobacteria bacterium]